MSRGGTCTAGASPRGRVGGVVPTPNSRPSLLSSPTRRELCDRFLKPWFAGSLGNRPREQPQLDARCVYVSPSAAMRAASAAGSEVIREYDVPMCTGPDQKQDRRCVVSDQSRATVIAGHPRRCPRGGSGEQQDLIGCVTGSDLRRPRALRGCGQDL